MSAATILLSAVRVKDVKHFKGMSYVHDSLKSELSIKSYLFVQSFNCFLFALASRNIFKPKQIQIAHIRSHASTVRKWACAVRVKDVKHF